MIIYYVRAGLLWSTISLETEMKSSVTQPFGMNFLGKDSITSFRVVKDDLERVLSQQICHGQAVWVSHIRSKVARYIIRLRSAHQWREFQVKTGCGAPKTRLVLLDSCAEVCMKE